MNPDFVTDHDRAAVSDRSGSLTVNGDTMRMIVTAMEHTTRLGLVLIIVAFGTRTATCQEANSPIRETGAENSIPTPPPIPRPSVAAEPESRSPLELLPAEIKYLPDALGKLHAIPANASLQGYLDFIAKPRMGDRDNGAPHASVSSIELTGEANDERVEFNAHIVVQLRQANDFVRVPLQLNEASLVKREYTGSGDVIFERDPDKGLVYWLRGSNPHVLDLTMIVRVRSQLPSRRLQLTLPSSPISKLKLAVPHRSVTARTTDKSEELPLEVTSLENNRSQIEVYGLGNRVDLQWQPTPDTPPSEATLEANTTILAQVDSHAVLLDVHQWVQSLQGKFDSFAVQLPQGAEVLKIEDDDSMPRERRNEGYRERRIDPARPNRVVVGLTGPSLGPIRLRWTVRLPRPDRRRLTLDGFIVESARKQSGEVGLAPHDGLRLSPIQHKDANILRINAAELKADVGSAQVTRAYRFLNQPFSLVVGVDPIEPYFLVEPRIFLMGAVHQLTMDAAFQFQVTSESLSEVSIFWPEAKTEGWIIDGFDPPDLVQKEYDEDAQGMYRLRLIKPQSTQFHIHMRARRPAKINDDIAFTLPRARASSPSVPSLVVFNAENVETELTTRGETVVRSIPSNPSEPLLVPELFRGLKYAMYRIDTEEQAFALRVIPQPRRLRTESSVESVVQSGQIQVTQRLIYNVSYERMSQLKLAVPRSLTAERIRFFGDRNVELSPEWSEGSDQQTRQVRLVLSEPKIGRFEVLAKFVIRTPEDAAVDGDGTVQIPIIQCADETFAHTRFVLARDTRFEASALSEQWKPQPLRPEAWSWHSEGSRPEFGLRLTRSGGNANGTASVSRGLVTAMVELDGRTMMRAQFRISARSDSLLVTLPADAELPKFHWDQTVLPRGTAAVEIPANSNKYSLHLPTAKQRPAGSSDHLENKGSLSPTEISDRLLTIDYLLPNAVTVGLPGTVELHAPNLPQCSWDAAVIWQTSLPPNQHLFTHPASATPMFRWHRVGFFWYRISDPEASSLERWIDVTSGPAPEWPISLDSPQLARNLYSFSQISAPRGLKFYTLSSPMVVLFGAGVSFLFGFILLRIRALRHVLTVLTAGLILAAIGLWNAAPLELLMQPMIVGLVFPLVAVLIEGWFRRTNGATILAMPTAAELAAAHGSHIENAVSPAEQSTEMRPPREESGEAMRVETGSGVS